MYKELLKQIKSADTIRIFRHSNPDGDAFGSSLGLLEIIKDNFPNKDVKVASEETNEFVSKFFPKPSVVKVTGEELLIVTDTANVDRIDGPKLDWSKSIKIDHHPNNEDYGQMFVGGTEYASASEIIAEFALEQKLEISSKAAKYMYIGIVTDTGRFQYNSTTRRTHEIAGALLEKIHGINEFYSKMLNKPMATVKFNNKIQSGMKSEGKVTYFIMPTGLEKKYGVPYSQASSSSYLMMAAEETKYGLFASKDPETGLYRVSLRSKEKAINKVAEEFGGGGHAMASGLKLNSKKEIKQVIKKLKEL